MQQIYAKIKTTSKYSDQNEIAKAIGEYPFPVYIDAETIDSYCVYGGPGASYRMEDLTFYVRTKSGHERRIG